jgi:hypothetical protein
MEQNDGTNVSISAVCRYGSTLFNLHVLKLDQHELSYLLSHFKSHSIRSNRQRSFAKAGSVLRFRHTADCDVTVGAIEKQTKVALLDYTEKRRAAGPSHISYLQKPQKLLA